MQRRRRRRRLIRAKLFRLVNQPPENRPVRKLASTLHGRKFKKIQEFFTESPGEDERKKGRRRSFNLLRLLKGHTEEIYNEAFHCTEGSGVENDSEKI